MAGGRDRPTPGQPSRVAAKAARRPQPELPVRRLIHRCSRPEDAVAALPLHARVHTPRHTARNRSRSDHDENDRRLFLPRPSPAASRRYGSRPAHRVVHPGPRRPGRRQSPPPPGPRGAGRVHVHLPSWPASRREHGGETMDGTPAEITPDVGRSGADTGWPIRRSHIRPAGRRPGSALHSCSPVPRARPGARHPARSSAAHPGRPPPWTRPPAAEAGCILLRQPRLAR